MSDYLKKRERERKLEKIRGKVRNGNGSLKKIKKPDARRKLELEEADAERERQADELVLYIQNTAELYPDVKAIQRNLITHWARDNYKRAGAEKSFKRLADIGAKRYMREILDMSGSGFGPFTPAIRKQAASDLTDEYEGAANLGNYDYLLPARYGHKVRKA